MSEHGLKVEDHYRSRPLATEIEAVRHRYPTLECPEGEALDREVARALGQETEPVRPWSRSELGCQLLDDVLAVFGVASLSYEVALHRWRLVGDPTGKGLTFVVYGTGPTPSEALSLLLCRAFVFAAGVGEVESA